MTEIEITEHSLIMHVTGVDKILAFKGRLEVPLSHIISAKIDPGVAQEFENWFVGMKAPGTGIPGVIRASTWYTGDGKVFWDVHDPQYTITVRLAHETYNRLLIDVAAPPVTVTMIEEALRTYHAS